ncbi:uncharacterized protein LOC133338626 [Musca vetustissima]|uniref:uncharacterized protein LOC133338626 n=1 Tax=Musca vetustissima TaxID=27455 RepID=UPI002AB7C61C|nr:uncharacterized protein LOC133338626 [Musca vetustissima]
MSFMSSQYDDILKGVKKNTKTIKCLKKENATLKEDVKKLQSTVTFLNEVRLQNDCVINGITVDDKTKPIDVVIAVANTIGAKIVEDDVEDAYFLKKKNQASPKTVVVKFVNNKTKLKFMQEKKKLREQLETKSVYINDFVSKDTMEVFHHAKSLKAVGYKFIYTHGGKVFAKKDEKSKQIRLKSMGDVDDLLKQVVSKGKHERKLIEVELSDDDEEEEDSDDEENDDEDVFHSPN